MEMQPLNSDQKADEAAAAAADATVVVLDGKRKRLLYPHCGNLFSSATFLSCLWPETVSVYNICS